MVKTLTDLEAVFLWEIVTRLNCKIMIPYNENLFHILCVNQTISMHEITVSKYKGKSSKKIIMNIRTSPTRRVNS